MSLVAGLDQLTSNERGYGEGHKMTVDPWRRTRGKCLSQFHV